MKTLLAIFFIAFNFYTSAQTRLAITGGFNYSNARVYADEVKQACEFVPGGNAGLQVETFFEGRLHFAPFINYSSRGFTIKADSNKNDQSRSFIHYINIVPALNFHLSKNQNQSLVITASTGLGIALSGKQRNRVNGVTTTSKMNFSTTKDYSLVDIFLHAAIAYQYQKLFLGFGYDYGLANINNNVEFDKIDLRNRTISFNLGYYFKPFR